MNDAWVAFLGGLLGAGIAALSGVLISLIGEFFERGRLKEERRIRKAEVRNELIQQQFIQIEKFVSIRYSMIDTLVNSYIHYQAFLSDQLSEIWKIGGEGVQARANAYQFGGDDLVNKLLRLENIFGEVLSLFLDNRLNSEGQKLQLLTEAKQLSNDILGLLNEIRPKVINRIF